MKKIILLALVVISLNASAQQAKDSVIKDSVKATDSTALFSVNDIKPVIEQLKKMPYEQVANVLDYFAQLIQYRANEFTKPKKQK